MARRRGYRKIIEADLDIMPLMNLFVVLIPMLLLSAVFVEISAIDMDAPAAAEEVSTPRESLDLAIEVRADRYVVRGRGLRERTIARDEASADTTLAAHLDRLRRDHPDESAVRILSPPRVRYQEIITVMDISRSVGLGAISLVGRDPAGSGRTVEAR